MASLAFLSCPETDRLNDAAYAYQRSRSVGRSAAYSRWYDRPLRTALGRKGQSVCFAYLLHTYVHSGASGCEQAESREGWINT